MKSINTGSQENKVQLKKTLTESSPPIAESKAGRIVPRWKLRPGPATSAKAPRACALKALDKCPKFSKRAFALKWILKKSQDKRDTYDNGGWTSLGKIWGKTAAVLTLKLQKENNDLGL